MHTTKDVPITSISSTFQIRESTDEKHVQEILRSIQEDGWKPGEYLDVIQPNPEQEKFKLADGNHRLQALKLLGWTEAPIRIIGSTDLDLYKQAYKVNAGHGVRLTRAEKEHFIKEMLKLYCGVLHKWPLGKFIEEFEISRPTAQKYKDQLEQNGFEFPETVIGKDGNEYPVKIKTSQKQGFKILNPDEQKPDPQTGMIFCAKGCGTPTYPEHLEAEGSTWIQKEGQWFCSEECAEQWEQERFSDEAEALTGIPDELPETPSSALPLNDEDEPEPVKREAEPEFSEEEDNAEIVNEIASMLKNFRPQRINNIIILLFNVLNLKVENIFKTRKKNILKGINAESYEKKPLSEEEKTGFVWKLNDGSDWELARPYLETFKTLYPGIDVEQELRNSIGWSIANPKNRKTKTGILKHLTTWLGNAQNRAARQGSQRNSRKSGYVSRDAGLDFENLEY